MDAFIKGIPKAELHVHLEGTFEPEMMLAMAARNGVALGADTPQALRAAYRFTDLQSFLDLYYAGVSTLRNEQDFYALTRAYLERAHDEGVVHVEPFFDPQAHTGRGVALEAAVRGITRALDEAEAQRGTTSGLILCFLRHLSADDAERTLDAAMAHRERIIGVGLDSAEIGHPPSKFAGVFQRAREAGLKLCCHAGEEGPPEYVAEAIDLLAVDRIDHGNRAMEDEALVARLAARGTPLTLCPLSNLRLKNVDRAENHPLKRMLDAGLKVTVNSDDPAYFGGYIVENYAVMRDGLGLGRDDLRRLARNAMEASFASPERKAALVAMVEAYFA